MIITATSQQIATTKSCLQAHQQDAGTTTLVDVIDQHLRVIITPGITTVTIGIDTGPADPDLAPIILDIGITVAVTLTGVTLDPFYQPSHCSSSCHRSSSTYYYCQDKTALHILLPQEFLQR